MRHWKCQGIHPLVSDEVFITTGGIHSPISTSARGSQPHTAPSRHRTASLMLSPPSLIYQEMTALTPHGPCITVHGASRQNLCHTRAQPAHQEYLPSPFTSKRKMQGIIGAATESSPEKGTIKALRFNVTCLIEPLEAQSCIKFPYNYALGEKQT